MENDVLEKEKKEDQSAGGMPKLPNIPSPIHPPGIETILNPLGGGKKKKRGLLDVVNNNASSTVQNVQQAQQVIKTVSTIVKAAPILTNPFVLVGIVILFIIIFIVFFSGGGGSTITNRFKPGEKATSQPGAGGVPGGGAPTCGGTGTLDYTIPVYDTTIIPPSPEITKKQILSSWPNARIENYETIVQQSIANGWNPSFLLTLWTEESGAQGVKADDPLGCLLEENIGKNDINKSLSCFFNTFKDHSVSFEDIMCTYGGDNFNKAPCTFTKYNPHFPGNIRDWYAKIAGSVSPVVKCEPVAAGGWPTLGYITQGPLGAFDHAGIKSRTGWDSIDVASLFGTMPPVYSAFDGVVSEAHSCVVDNTCGVHYGNYVVVSVNNGAFSVMHGHLSRINVTAGQTVKAGEQLGIMGTTGNSTGVHLHWEFRGAAMAPPNTPSAITPLNCDTPSIPCSPDRISPGDSGSTGI